MINLFPVGRSKQLNIDGTEFSKISHGNYRLKFQTIFSMIVISNVINYYYKKYKYNKFQYNQEKITMHFIVLQCLRYFHFLNIFLKFNNVSIKNNM